jgi:hypothetical protein
MEKYCIKIKKVGELCIENHKTGPIKSTFRVTTTTELSNSTPDQGNIQNQLGENLKIPINGKNSKKLGQIGNPKKKPGNPNKNHVSVFFKKKLQYELQ